MTLKEVQALSDEELQIKMAELDRWDAEDIERGYTLSQFSEKVPSYCNDLNAMHYAEESLTDEQFCKYQSALIETFEGTNYTLRALISASARQRIEAFVLTMKGT